MQLQCWVKAWWSRICRALLPGAPEIKGAGSELRKGSRRASQAVYDPEVVGRELPRHMRVRDHEPHVWLEDRGNRRSRRNRRRNRAPKVSVSIDIDIS